MAKKGLGRGLGSLIPPKNNNQLSSESKSEVPAGQALQPNTSVQIENKEVPKLADKAAGVMLLPLDEIKPNPKQPRTVFGHYEMDELINSVKQHGILQPIMVKPAIDDKHEIIMGERRWRAAKMAGLKNVPVIVKHEKLSDKETLELAIIENVQRKDLTPIEEAKSYQRLVDEFGMTQDEVSDKIGKSRPSVANYIRLLSLPEEIQQGLQDNKITMGHAKSLLGLDSPAKQLDLYRKIMVNSLNVRDTERIVRKSDQTKKAPISNPIQREGMRRLEALLRDTLKTKVKIDEHGGKGKITIDFYSDDELQNIIGTITKL